MHKLKSNQSDRLHIPDPAFNCGELSNVRKRENAHNTLRIMKCPIIHTKFKQFWVKWIQSLTLIRRNTTLIINLILMVNIQFFWYRTRCRMEHRYQSLVFEWLMFFYQVCPLHWLGLCVCVSVCLRPNMLLSALFSHALHLWFSFTLRDQAEQL